MLTIKFSSAETGKYSAQLRTQNRKSSKAGELGNSKSVTGEPVRNRTGVGWEQSRGRVGTGQG